MRGAINQRENKRGIVLTRGWMEGILYKLVDTLLLEEVALEQIWNERGVITFQWASHSVEWRKRLKYSDVHKSFNREMPASNIQRCL